MKKNVILTLTAGLFAFNGVAQAAPSIYAKNLSQKVIVNTSNANIIFDDESESKVWVLPPNTGTSQVSDYMQTHNANMGFCGEMSSLQKKSAELLERIDLASKEHDKSQVEILEMLKQYEKARVEADALKVSPIVKQLGDYDERLEVIEANLAELSAKIETCTQGCDGLRAMRTEARKEKAVLVEDRRKLVAENLKEVRAYEKKVAAAAAMKANIDDREDYWQRIENRLFNLKDTFLKMYSSFGGMEGAQANFQYDTKWDEQLSTLKAANPNYDFIRIPTKNVVITTNIPGAAGFPSGGAILNYAISGSPDSKGVLRLDSFTGAYSTNVVLSLLGACPMRDPAAFGFPTEGPGKPELSKMKYGLTAAYEYATAFNLSAKVTYNMHKFYQKIVSSGSKGGFFKSRSWSAVEERTFFKDEFKVDWSEEASEHTMSDEAKAEKEREMRNAILGRLANIGLPAAVNAGALVVGVPPKTGAVVLADSLMQTCPTNIYCVGASIGMNVLQAIFGSSSTAASYTNTQDAWMVEQWGSKKMLYRPYVTSYN